MRLLAIHLGHNSTAALSNGGEIVGVLSQEKCDNIKNSAIFPKDAILKLLSELDWDIDDIDQVIVSSTEIYPPIAYEYLFDSRNEIKPTSSAVALGKKVRDSIIGKLFPFIFQWLKNYRVKILTDQGMQYLSNELKAIGLGKIPVEYVDHHLCHARASYHALEETKKEEPGLIFTMDGSGDGLCATVTLTDGKGGWKRIAATPENASLGGVYSNTTRFLGMKILEHEYKVMGLAPYAKEKYMLETYERIFKPVIWLSSDNPLVFESKINTSNFYDYLGQTAVGERFDNMAAALQYLTEELVIQWIRSAIQQTGVRRIFTGGGVFMNVKLNRRIQEMVEVEQAHFMPSCGDESNPIGASYDYAVRSGSMTKPLNNLYLGVSYSNKEIEEFIESNNLRERYEITYYDDIEEKIAELLADREIVARFSGRCEWGARSLGNRAILAHPSHMESFYTINDYIKSRDFWMPFAPSMLDTAASKYLEDYDPNKAKAPYMITAYAATELGVMHLRAALHQGDHTLRPQVVDEYTNPEYYRLIKAFEKVSGVGALLNTSFNLHGFPLVASPEQALMTLKNSDLSYLALQNFIIRKI